MLTVHIYGANRQKKLPVTKKLRTLIKRSCLAVLYEEGYSGNFEISLTLVDNDEIKRINSYYRDVDKITDVLSFPMFEKNEQFTEDPETGSIMLGDIIISLEKAQAQAAEYGHSFERETAFLTVHSMLHLLGYDHETGEDDERVMFGKQDIILNALGLNR